MLGVEGNEMADLHAKGSADDSIYAVDRAYLGGAHMTRFATGTGTSETNS